jgi:hypothetical protein
MRPRSASIALPVILLGVSAIVADGDPVPRQWGTLEGRVVWAEKKLPVNPPIPGVPPAFGPVLEDKIVVNPKNKGVRWVLVWLADPEDARKAKFAPPIHPSLKNPPPAEIDSPRAAYEPRVLGLWTKQSLTVKNSNPVASTFLMQSIGGGPNENRLVLPMTQATINGFVPNPIPTPFSCGVRRWMKGYVGTFAHPYFAVTDAEGKFKIEKAPVGKYPLVLWHEEVGFLTMTSKKLRGRVIEIKGKGVTDVGWIQMKLPRD